jgi:hypothetical protein
MQSEIHNFRGLKIFPDYRMGYSWKKPGDTRNGAASDRPARELPDQ